MRHLLEGDNGQGKTNVVEALAFFALGASFRGADRAAMIQQGATTAVLELDLVRRQGTQTLKAVLTRSGHRFFLDGKEQRRQRDVLGLVNVVTFAPSDVFLFQAAPKERRELLDVELTKQSPSYAYALQQYQQALKQRNELLKHAQPDPLVWEALDQYCSRYGSELVRRRRDFLQRLEPSLQARYQALSDQQVAMTLHYDSEVSEQESEPQTYYLKLVAMHGDDRARGLTQLGPHRDDFTLKADGIPFASYGSQGEQRLGVIALKFCFAELAYLQRGDAPILVFDDLFSELDGVRQMRVFQQIQTHNQVFLTMADAAILQVATQATFERHHVRHGTIETRRSS